jgi:SNF2 family DNA or RNA helicase
VIDRSQAEKRIIRKGQTRKCFIYDLVAYGTVDDKILEFHRQGQSLFDSLLGGDPQKVLALQPEPV